jgi:hypothetical protein
VSDILKGGVDALMGLLKTQGVPAVTASLENLSNEATEDWQKALLKIGVHLIAENGPDGLNLLEDTVSRLLDNKPVNLSALTMQEASDILAIMQRREADHKNQVTLYTQMILETLGKALSTLVSVIFKEIKL